MRKCNVFEIDHRPFLFEHRDPQLRELASAVKPGMEGNRPFNTILLGLPGTGKTTCVRTLFNEIEITSNRIVPVYVNCQNDRTKYAVFSAISEKLFGHRPPPSGLPFHSLVENIGRTLINRNVVLVVCLDDANYLLPNKVLNNTLYCLLRLYEEFPGAKAGVILAVSVVDLDITKEIDPAVNSVLQASEIYFPPYSHIEAREILGERIREGLVHGAMTSEVLDLITDKTMETGDMRVGLDVIRRSVRNAEEHNSTEVYTLDVECAFKESRYYHLDAMIGILSPEEKRLLGYIAGKSQDIGSCMTSGALYTSVHEKMDVSYSMFMKRLQKFDYLRLIDLTYRQRKNNNEIAVRYDGQKVQDKCLCPD